jgi:hypothetical protein
MDAGLLDAHDEREGRRWYNIGAAARCGIEGRFWEEKK